MKLKYFILSSLAFVQFSHAQDTKNVKIHNDLTTALEQVDTDGEYLKLQKAGQIMETLASMADEYFLAAMVKSGDLPEDFSFTKALGLTGISDITASSESVKKDGENYISKQFIQTNGSRKGILSLLGKADKPWASLEYAPANTALLLETHLDLTSVPQIMKQIAPMMKERDAVAMLEALAQQDPIAGNTIEQLLLQADARISIIAELDQTKTWGPPNQQFPVVHATGRIDGIAKFLWANYGPVISKQVPVQSVGNIHTIVSPEKVPAPWGPLTPVIVIDTDKNHIWFSLSAEHLLACQTGKSKLTDNKDFQVVNKHYRDSGAGRLYISKKLMATTVDLLQANMKEEVALPTAKKAVFEVVQHIKTLGGISSCVSHDEKGIHVHTNAPFPIKNAQLAGLPLISSLAGLSYMPMMKNIESSQRTEDIMKVKMIYSGLLGYMAGNDNTFPNNLQQLVDGEHITKESLILQNRKLHYLKGLTPNDFNKIILYTSPDKDGMAIYARVDGSVRAIDHFELEELLAKQNE